MRVRVVFPLYMGPTRVVIGERLTDQPWRIELRKSLKHVMKASSLGLEEPEFVDDAGTTFRPVVG